MSEPVFLVADIGATNARFALGREGALLQKACFATPEAGEVRELIELARAALGFSKLAGACVAVAGPVQNHRGRITNGSLEFDAAEIGALLNCPVAVVNDFHALARSLPVLQHLRQIGGTQAGVLQPSAPKAVIGPGSGLGMALLVPHGDSEWLVVPSEGGHADVAPGTPLEHEILQILLAQHEQVCWETVLSGPGLVNLYRAVCALWDVAPEEVAPEWITRNAVDAEVPICHQTVELFFGILGGAAGNLALMACAEGGVYIGGGIVPQLAEFAAASALRRRFDERGALSDYSAQIPLYVILDDDPGMIGALQALS